MKNCWILLSVFSLLVAGSAAQVSSQQNQTASAAPAKTVTAAHISDGTPVLVELSKGLNAKKAKPGDQVKAVVVQDVLSQGKVVIRRGSKLVGHVTHAKPHSKEDAESHLGIVFDRAKLKGGGELNLNAAGIEAIAAGTRYSMVDKPDEMMPSSISGSTGPRPVSPIGGRPTQTRGAQPAIAAPVNTGNAAVTVPVLVNESSKTYEGSVLSSGSRGVFGIPGIKLHFDSTRDANKTLMVSNRENVKLDSGIQLLLQVTAPLEH